MNLFQASFALLAEWIRRSRIGVLLLASLALWVIYSNPPLDRCQAPPDLSSALCQKETNTSKLLLDEHAKVVDEIKMRIEDENELYRYKFVLMGGLLLAFLGHIALPLLKDEKRIIELTNGKTDRNTNGPEERIAKLMNSSATFLVLGLAFTIAVTIDLHMRTATIAMNQLALWIKDYVEPAFIHKPLMGYETYLRLPGAMSDSIFYGFMYWPPLSLVSWLIYLAYLIVLQNVFRQRTQRRMQILLGFVLVHSSLAAFAWMGHTAPSAFQFTLFGWPVNGSVCPFLYLIPLLVLAYVNWCYVGPLARMK